ncbi:MAG: hypothetical protein AAFP20_18130 [Cyanobacteria bacterium J06614_10]
MKFTSQQLPSGKWGIFSGPTLLATISSQATCETIMANLLNGRRDAPQSDKTTLYQAPTLKNATRKQSSLKSVGSTEKVGHSRSIIAAASTSRPQRSATAKPATKSAASPTPKRISTTKRKAERKGKEPVVHPTAS